MITAVNRCQGRAADSGGMFRRKHRQDDLLLKSRHGQAILARIDGATSEFFIGDRDSHVRQVALMALHAQNNSPGRPTAPTMEETGGDHHD